MARVTQCPQCGGKEFKALGDSGRQCASCGAQLVYRTAWVPFLLTWALVGAVVGLAVNFAFSVLDVDWNGTARMLVFGALTGIVATLISRRFRRLSRA